MKEDYYKILGLDKNASDLDRRLNKFFENAVKELNEKNKKQIYELDKKLNTNKRAWREKY